MATPTTAWNDVWRAEMVLLGQSYQTLLKRGAKPVARAPSTSSSSNAPEPIYNVSTSIKPKTGSVFLPSKKSLSDSVSSGSASTSAPAPRVQPAPSPPVLPSAPTISRVPSIFTSSVEAPASSKPAPAAPAPRAPEPAPSALASAFGALSKVGTFIWTRLPEELRATVKVGVQPLSRGLARQRVLGSVASCLPNRDDDRLIIESGFSHARSRSCEIADSPLSALSALVSASLAEDPYGQVQRDIPKTLEALLSYLTALDTFVAELETAAKARGPDHVAETRAVLAAEVDDLVTGQSACPCAREIRSR